MAPTACPHKAWFNEPYSVRITGRGAALLNIAHKCGIFFQAIHLLVPFLAVAIVDP
jgi:hypothetical protein